jgi:dimethylaniline monooxygenase (N-oxide forming)
MRVCVIGAGASGLVAIKELKEEGHDVTCYEQYDKVGGVFYHNNNKGGVSDLTLLTISNYFMAFSSYFPNEEECHYWTHQEYANYLFAFIEHFKLKAHIQHSKRVTSISIVNEKVKVEVLDVKTNKSSERMFDSVCVCSGTHQTPRYPQINGLDKFKGKKYHSAFYKNNQQYVGKNVICIGLGETAADVAHEVSQVANKCVLSIRHRQSIVARYPHGRKLTNDAYSSRILYQLPTALFNNIDRFLNKYRLKGKICDQERMMIEWNLSIPDYINHFLTKNDAFFEDILSGNLQLNESGISHFDEDTVYFKDGQQEQIDTIIFCTGYQDNFNFVKDVEIKDVRRLYKHMVHPELGTKVVFIGWARPALGGAPVCSEMQSRYYAKLLSNKLALPSKHHLQQLIEQQAYYEDQVFRHNMTVRTVVHYQKYMDDFADILKCKPTLGYMLRHPILAYKITFGSHVAFIYRLQGEDKNEKLAKEIISRLPVAWRGYELILLTCARIYSLISKKIPGFKNDPAY